MIVKYFLKWPKALNLQTVRKLSKKFRICVVGSGPAGFYTAQHVLKSNKDIYVDIFDKSPVPFGLVRYGVAPDHPEIKNVCQTFEEIARNPRCTFYGNVNIGQDLRISNLSEIYCAVVLAFGADDDKKLNITGEVCLLDFKLLFKSSCLYKQFPDAEGVVSARSFVGWYNGLSAHANLSVNLDCETAVIVGQGNVALDVARILLAPLKHLEKTDICKHAYDALSKSRIRRVHIVGRRSPLEVSFTIKELREMINLEDTIALFNPEDFKNIEMIVEDLPRQRKRIIDLMCKTATLSQKQFYSSKDNPLKDKKLWSLDFLKNPVKILTSAHKVTGIRFEKNKLDIKNNIKVAIGMGVFEDLTCGMVLRSIGYKSIKIDNGIPFDAQLGIIPNINGRVVERVSSKDVVKGLYCSGWVKHGPVGMIVTTMNEAYETAENIIRDMKSGIIQDKFDTNVEEYMKLKGIKYVSFDGYKQIDFEEVKRGNLSKKPREKIVSLSEMLDYAFKNNK
ncbi:NADPH:adrenodoxin oxidoreductase, mitochondrial isoform X2 [Hydra vulgaris]|uniref:NADPH:adrenodoxin oxidoreductase, mitochondrial n=1 Tax=Hydra vulgaris TaxID=6087 RepID=A0ABM4CDD9_HYDVU